MNENTKCGMHIQLNIIQPLKGRKSCHILKHRWTFKSLAKRPKPVTEDKYSMSTPTQGIKSS